MHMVINQMEIEEPETDDLPPMEDDPHGIHLEEEISTSEDFA